jgi:hypothetical protein
MLIQVIEGKARDVEGLKARGDSWDAELKPGAVGYLGSTGGVTSDGTAVTVARFESPEAAAANSARPEQGAWFAQTAALYDGDVSFADFELEQMSGGGGSDEAGFVQILRGRTKDAARMRELGEELSKAMPSLRPDYLGGYTAIRDDGEFVSVNYFTSEQDARKGEAQEYPPEVQALFDEMFADSEGLRFIDLSDPWFSSP